MHQAVMDWVKARLDQLGPRKRVVEIGSYDINGSVRPLFGQAAYTGVDLRDGPGVDVVEDGAAYAPKEPPDTVVCCEMLEHWENAAGVVANAHEMLAPGGVLLVTAATDSRAPHSGIDGGPLRPDEYYQNVTRKKLEKWLEPFASVTVEEHPERGDIYALAVKAAQVAAPVAKKAKKRG